MRIFYLLLLPGLLSCSSHAAKADTFDGVFYTTQKRWETSFEKLNERAEYCDALKDDNLFEPPTPQTLKSQHLTQRQYEVGMYLMSRELTRECMQDVLNQSAYDLGVFHLFIHQNIDDIRKRNLMPEEDLDSSSDYTGNAEIIFEEDIMVLSKMRAEFGPFTPEQNAFFRTLVSNKPFEALNVLPKN